MSKVQVSPVSIQIVDQSLSLVRSPIPSIQFASRNSAKPQTADLHQSKIRCYELHVDILPNLMLSIQCYLQIHSSPSWLCHCELKLLNLDMIILETFICSALLFSELRTHLSMSKSNYSRNHRTSHNINNLGKLITEHTRRCLLRSIIVAIWS